MATREAPVRRPASATTAPVQLQGLRTGRPEDGAYAPPEVHRVLSTSGQPLAPILRSRFEQGFSQDFSHVRVHADETAARSAQAVSAQAYTVGRHIVFGPGRFTPETPSGQHLLAHELAHTLQQGATAAIPPRLRMGKAGSSHEAQADAMAAQALSGTGKAAAPHAIGPQLQAQSVGMGELRVAEQLDSERTAEEASRTRTPAKMAGHILTGTDITNAQRAAPGSASPTRITPGIRSGRFVLHDTASPVGAARIAEHATHGRRSSGEGAGAWVPASGAATVTHTPFFGPRRPAATQFERGQDIMDKPAREAAYRAVWRATTTSVREAALDNVLSTQGSPPAEAATERATAIRELGAARGDVHSAGAWAVEDICNAAPVPAAGATPTAQQTACQSLATLFNTRSSRIGTTTNVEIVQERGSDCRTTPPLTPLPAYTTDQYNNVMQVYLRASLEARFFPSITTHLALDRGVGDHCDPRCFNLSRLYTLIASALSHPTGCTYGDAPVYGTTSASNVWWNNTVCGGAPP